MTDNTDILNGAAHDTMEATLIPLNELLLWLGNDPAHVDQLFAAVSIPDAIVLNPAQREALLGVHRAFETYTRSVISLGHALNADESWLAAHAV